MGQSGKSTNIVTNKEKLGVALNATSQAVVLAFFYVLMEWLFYITKPSFMDALPFGQKLNILFISGLVVSVFITAMILVIFLLDLLFSISRVHLKDSIYYFPSALVLASLALILFDNFTYTLIRVGVTTFHNWMRVFYLLTFVVVFLYLHKLIYQSATTGDQKRKRQFWQIAGGLLGLIAVVFFISQYQPADYSPVEVKVDDSYQYPNIILVSDDGLSAEHMSLYGYERETTPFLDSLAPSSLLMLNNFSNVNASTGSDTALLTGKLPFDTKLLYPPNILKGKNTLEHLPGVLKSLGYQSVSLGIPHYVDMGVINLQGGFDYVNCEERKPVNFIGVADSYGYNDPAYFLDVIEERLVDRILHISFIKDIKNSYMVVMDMTPENVHLNMDEAYTNLTNGLLQANQAGQPLFAHIHLLSTHGSRFFPEERVFSVGQEQVDTWMDDFYDDTILEYDRWLESLDVFLKENDLDQNTMVIYYTDHGEEWSAQARVPLMIHFPNGDHAGEVVANSQNLDIAPTILDYMGVEKAPWMMGESLLGDLAHDRLIFTTGVNENAVYRGSLIKDLVRPPFYQFGFINVIQCQNSYEIDLLTGEMIGRAIPAYVQPCSASELDEPDVIWDSAMALLRSYGYDIPPGWEEPVSYSEE